MQVGLVKEPFLGSDRSSLYSYSHTISLPTRELEGGYYEMNCTLKISAELLKQSMAAGHPQFAGNKPPLRAGRGRRRAGQPWRGGARGC